ncbi:MAG: hypothetical protein U0744_01315 [Gemmataceae bacterium]
MDIFDWVAERRREYARNKDQARFDLASVFHRAHTWGETEPDRYVAELRAAKQMAQQMDEPFWALYYQAFHLEGLVHYQRDFREALDLAAQCALAVQKPMFANWPGRFLVYNTMLYAYVFVDAWGYEDSIRKFIAYMDREVPSTPNHDRLVFLLRKTDFAMECDRWDEAREMSYNHMPIAEALGEPGYMYAIVSDLFRIEYERGNWDDMIAFPEVLENLNRDTTHPNYLAESLAWRAVMARQRGNEEMAQKRFASAERRMARVDGAPSREYFLALAAFHEVDNDFAGALAIRERELAAYRDSGKIAHIAASQIERCRMKKRLGTLTQCDVNEAEKANQALRKPATFRAKLERAIA